MLLLTRLVVGDRRVFGQRFDQPDHLLAEACAQRLRLHLGVLGDVVQQGGGEHLVRIVVLGKQLGDRQRVLDEGDLVAAGLAELAAVGAAGDREGASDQRRALSL